MGIAFEKAKTDESCSNYLEELNDLWEIYTRNWQNIQFRAKKVLRVTATLYTGTESGKPQKADSALSSLANSCFHLRGYAQNKQLDS